MAALLSSPGISGRIALATGGGRAGRLLPPQYDGGKLAGRAPSLPRWRTGRVSRTPGVSCHMRYLVKGRVKRGRERALLNAIKKGTLGQGSVAGDEYLHNMQEARVAPNGNAHWVETCF